MQGLVSLVPQPYMDNVVALWDELETTFGLKGVRITPFPHISWQIAEEYPEEALLKALQEVTQAIKPISVHIKGIETFVSQTPVVFLKVYKDPALIKEHFRVWLKFLPIAKGLSMLYSPPLWRPHITLTYQDLTREQMPEVVKYLRAKPIDWEFTLDNLSFLVENPAGSSRNLHSFKLQG
ncbi:MAG: 2'-5' RNA ligase family protein [Anaerolineaceae bacterium]|nr:2'-5' RNA ligase family protein [Anaerolineaceae bacterium]